MRIVWAFAIFLLSLAAVPAGAAERYELNVGYLQFDPPRGYCMVGFFDPVYSGLAQTFTRPGRTIKGIFRNCTDTGTEVLDAGYISFGAEVPGQLRSGFVAGEAALYGQAVGPEALEVDGVNDSGVFLKGTTHDDAAGTTWVEEHLLTLALTTPVMVGIIRIVPDGSGADIAGVEAELRTLLHEELTAFGRLEGYTPRDGVTPEAAAGAYMMGFNIGSLCFGGVLLIAIRWRRVREQAFGVLVTVALGMFAYQNATAAMPLTGSFLLDIPILLVLAGGVLAIANFLLHWLTSTGGWRERMVDSLRGTITPDAWPSHGPADRKGFAKRWFVTVSAATGAVIVTILDNGALELLGQAFAPNHILFTIIAAVVSLTLVGPVEEYIFDQRALVASRESEEPEESRFETMMRMLSPRALGRLALVLLLVLLLGGLNSVVEERITGGDSGIASVILASAAVPATVTYFWCSALQRRTRRVWLRTGIASFVAGFFLQGLPLASMYVILSTPYIIGYNDVGMIAALSGVALLLVLGLAPIISLGFFALPAILGALAIAQAERRALTPFATIAVLTGVETAYNVAMFFVTFWGLSQVMEVNWGVLFGMGWPVLLAPVGWGMGLLVSGFPSVLKASRRRPGVEAAPPTEPEAAPA